MCVISILCSNVVVHGRSVSLDLWTCQRAPVFSTSAVCSSLRHPACCCCLGCYLPLFEMKLHCVTGSIYINSSFLMVCTSLTVSCQLVFMVLQVSGALLSGALCGFNHLHRTKNIGFGRGESISQSSHQTSGTVQHHIWRICKAFWC